MFSKYYFISVETLKIKLTYDPILKKYKFILSIQIYFMIKKQGNKKKSKWKWLITSFQTQRWIIKL